MKIDQWSCRVEVSPDEVDAGADITVRVIATPPRGHRGSEPSISIRNRDDAELAHAELTKSKGEEYATGDLVLAAPPAAGTCAYRAVLIMADDDGIVHELLSTEIPLAVKVHESWLNAWGIPSAIVADEPFKFTVGVKCSAGCKLAGRELILLDHESKPIGAAVLRGDVWPGTEALYSVEVEANAPSMAGDYKWQIKTTEWDSELPHAEGSFTIPIKVIDAADCEVTVEVVDTEGVPIKSARVVMHPHRALTDEGGIAKVKVTKGQYDVLVSGSKHIPFCTAVAVEGDMRTRVELILESPPEIPDEVLD